MFLPKITTAKFFRDAVAAEYPALEKDPSYWRMMEYLMFSTWKCKETEMFGTWRWAETDALLLWYKLIAKIEGKESLADSRNYCAEKFLERFQKDVMGEDNFQWTPWDKSNKIPRAVKVCIFTPKVTELLDIERKQFWNIEDKVYFRDGRKVSRAKQKDNRDEIMNQALSAAAQVECKEAKDILNYLNTLKQHGFTKIVKENQEAAVQAAFNLEKETSRTYNLNVLKAIEIQSQPFYQPSREQNTVRVFPLNTSILMLSRNVRKVLTKGWTECDLANSQLAICAKEWEILEIQEYLTTGQSIWVHIFELYGINYNQFKKDNPNVCEEMKKVLKTALYALIFGMETSNVKRLVTTGLKRVGIKKAGNIFFSSPLIKAANSARRRKVEEIKLAGKFTTYYGKEIEVEWIEQEKKYNIDSILAQQAQAIEMGLIYPVIELARTTDEFEVTLWQHDGFSIAFKSDSKAELWLNRIKKAVDSKAEEMGILTHLEIAS